MPAGVVTVTSTVPAASAGSVAVICVPAELTATLVAALVPKSTSVAPLKPVPVMVTTTPPARVPANGLTSVTVGE